MKQNPKLVTLLACVAGGASFGVGMFLFGLSRGGTTPLWVRLVGAAGAAVFFAAAMFFSMYYGMVRPMVASPPPPGFADRKITWRDRLLGDGRPFPAAMRRANLVSSALAAGVGAFLVIVGVSVAAWPAVGVGGFVILVAVAVANLAISRHRSVPRPPYSTWLEQQNEGTDRER